MRDRSPEANLAFDPFEALAREGRSPLPSFAVTVGGGTIDISQNRFVEIESSCRIREGISKAMAILEKMSSQVNYAG
jgi:hypothetical protein